MQHGYGALSFGCFRIRRSMDMAHHGMVLQRTVEDPTLVGKVDDDVRKG